MGSVLADSSQKTLSLRQATSSSSNTKDKMMFNGFPALAVVVVCALYFLGCVVGDDTVPQEWHGQAGCPCCSIGNAIDGVNVGNICSIAGRELDELYEEARHYCPNDSDLINKLESLRALAAMKQCVNLNKLRGS